MKSIILHVDMNSYFASVEQQANPFLRGKSVGVCATLGPHGCIVASSKEAKAKGIKTGCRVLDALTLDPHIVLLPYDSDKYRTCTKKIFAILMRYTDRTEPYSIDEAFLDLTGYVPTFEKAAELGATIQTVIKKEVGEWLNCSIGIAPTRWLAKFAGDTAPKGSVLVLGRQDLPLYYEKFRLTDAWGINVRMERRLNALGIFTLNDLRTVNPHRLIRALGKPGYYLWADVNGIELGGLVDEALPKSIGHQHVMTNRRERNLPARVLMKLCERTGRRLRKLGLEAHGLSVWWSYVDGGGFHTARAVPRALFDTNDIFVPAALLLKEPELDHEILALSVSVFDLRPRSSQLSFFEDVEGRDRLVRSLDHLNDRYGEYTVIRGSMWATSKHAPDRVGFRKTLSMREQMREEGV